MPIQDPTTGRVCVWLISCLFFISIVTGGTFLVLFISLPQTAHWYPVAGVVLVGVPWFFWILTILYRCISRSCGFRLGGGFNGGRGRAMDGGSASIGTMPLTSGVNSSGGAPDDSQVETPTSTARRVRFGEPIVHGLSESSVLEEDIRTTYSSSNNDYDDISSVDSRLSELSLANPSHT